MLLEITSLLSVVNFMLLAIAVYIKSSKSPVRQLNTPIILLFALMAVYCLLVYIRYMAIDNKQIERLLYLPPVDGILLLAIPQCIYVYTCSLLGRTAFPPKLATAVHFLSYLLFVVFNISFLLRPSEQRIQWLIADFEQGSTVMQLLNLIIYIQLIGYLSWSYKQVTAQLKISEDIRIKETRYNIHWFKSYLGLSLIVVFTTLPACFYFNNERTSIIIGLIGMNTQFIYMFFKWTVHNEIATDHSFRRGKIHLSKKTMINTDEEILQKHLSLLIACMEHQQPYLDEHCSIKTVARLMNISERLLSNILNQKIEKSFHDFINEYRVSKAREMLIAGMAKETTIEHISTQCGFGSKSSFNRVFKKFNNNQTPSEFIRQWKENRTS